MARRPRIEIAGGIFHVGSRGATRQSIFRDDEDHEFFLGRLADVAARMAWRLHAHCLMRNHFHLVVETPEPNLARGMHLLKGPFARRFNKRYGASGHVFEDRYWNPVLATQSRYFDAMTYVALNPLRAGLCADPARWRWSSFGEVMNGRSAIVDRLRIEQMFGGLGADPITTYGRMVYALAARN